MLPRPRAAWLRLCPVALLACQSPPDITAEIDEYADLLSDANAFACNCPQDLGYATMTECGEALSPVDAHEYQCLVNALEGHEEDAKRYLDCANAAYQEYVDCLAGNVNCMDGWYDACTADHESAIAACPSLPGTLESSVIACTT